MVAYPDRGAGNDPSLISFSRGISCETHLNRTHPAGNNLCVNKQNIIADIVKYYGKLLMLPLSSWCCDIAIR